MLPIIVLNWNGIEDTIECLNSVFLSVYHNYHIHLIDNNSDNNQGSILRDKYATDSRVTVYLYDHNYGFAGAHIKIWHEQLCLQDNPYIVLLNNDTVVDPLWLSNLISFVKERSCDMVATKMIQYYQRNLMDNAGHMMLNTGEIMPLGHGQHIDLHTKPIKNIGACGGAALYSSKMLREIGFFDNHFTTGYEDAELGLRAAVAGYNLWYCPDSIIYHKGGQSIKKVFNEEYSTMIFSQILYSYFKNLKQSDIWINLPILILRYGIIMIIDIVLLRWKFFRILISSLKNTWKLRQVIKRKRKSIGFRRYSILNKMTFFLWIDIKRFVRIFVMRKESAIDSYGKEPK